MLSIHYVRAARKTFRRSVVVTILATLIYAAWVAGPAPIAGPATVARAGSLAEVQGSPSPVVRGGAGDLCGDVILGKPDFCDIAPGTTTANKLFWPHGVVIDRTSTPNRLYVYDAGNNRILGF